MVVKLFNSIISKGIIFFLDGDLLDSLLHQKYLFACGEKGVFAIKIDGNSFQFKSPAFGVSHKTTDEGEMRKFCIEIIETEPEVVCKAVIDEQNNLKIVDSRNEYEYELYGIIFSHEESIADLNSTQAVERFIKNLEEILPPIAHNAKNSLHIGN